MAWRRFDPCCLPKIYFMQLNRPLLDGAIAIYRWLVFRWSRINLPEEARVRKTLLADTIMSE